MENTERTKTQNTPTLEMPRTNRQRRKAVRLNDRIVVWAVDLFQRKTGQEKRSDLYGYDPLA